MYYFLQKTKLMVRPSNTTRV